MKAFRIVLLALLCVTISFPAYSEYSLRDKTVVLTFDDGPRREILKGPKGLLLLLEAEKIRATFFVQGWQAKASPDMVRELRVKGHIIANHTYGHASVTQWIKAAENKLGKDVGPEVLKEKGLERYLKDVDEGMLAILATAGYRPLFFRPPLWNVDQDLYCQLVARGYLVQTVQREIHDYNCPDFQKLLEGIQKYSRSRRLPEANQQKIEELWRGQERLRRDVNTEDYEIRDSHKLVEYVKKVIRNREQEKISVHILVFHELSWTTEALRILIPYLKRQGYRFENLPWIYGITEGDRP